MRVCVCVGAISALLLFLRPKLEDRGKERWNLREREGKGARRGHGERGKEERKSECGDAERMKEVVLKTFKKLSSLQDRNLEGKATRKG